MNKINIIEQELTKDGADAWIIVDYENKNKTLVSFLGEKMLTRKIFLVFPRGKKPFIICHSIDKVFLEDTKSSYDLKIYNTWKEMLEIEKEEFASYKKVLMDVSLFGLLPRVSLADFGSVDFIKSLGIEVMSSSNLLQRFSAVYSDESFRLQLKADELALKIKDEAFLEIKRRVLKDKRVSEYEIQQFIARRFHEEKMVYDEEPIVAIGKNASNPHYGPTADNFSYIKEGDLVLIDMWAKMDDPLGVYADITWMGYVGTDVPDIYEKRFQILKTAIDNCLSFLAEELPQRDIKGYEVDDISRNYINKQGFGDWFTHRTGHNIAVDVSPHGPGANIDNYESHDDRFLLDGTSFSLEPGIYAPDFGMRSETNIYLQNRKPLAVGGRQDKIIAILNLE